MPCVTRKPHGQVPCGRTSRHRLIPASAVGSGLCPRARRRCATHTRARSRQASLGNRYPGPSAQGHRTNCAPARAVAGLTRFGRASMLPSSSSTSRAVAKAWLRLSRRTQPSQTQRALLRKRLKPRASRALQPLGMKVLGRGKPLLLTRRRSPLPCGTVDISGALVYPCRALMHFDRTTVRRKSATEGPTNSLLPHRPIIDATCAARNVGSPAPVHKAPSRREAV
jgi:hypothetical protein